MEGLRGADRRYALELLNEMVQDGNAALCDDANAPVMNYNPGLMAYDSLTGGGTKA